MYGFDMGQASPFLASVFDDLGYLFQGRRASRVRRFVLQGGAGTAALAAVGVGA